MWNAQKPIFTKGSLVPGPVISTSRATHSLLLIALWGRYRGFPTYDGLTYGFWTKQWCKRDAPSVEAILWIFHFPQANDMWCASLLWGWVAAATALSKIPVNSQPFCTTRPFHLLLSRQYSTHYMRQSTPDYRIGWVRDDCPPVATALSAHIK